MAWVLSVLIAVSTGVLMPGTAAAHTVLKYSNPSAGQVLRTAPAQLELAFNEKLRAGTAQVAVTVGEAKPVEIDIQVGEDTITSDLAAEDLPVVPEGEAVRWKIGYRIVSEDGHPVAGVVEFVVDRTLLASTPADGAVLSALPSELELSFGRDITAVDPVAVSAGDTAEQQAPAVISGKLVRVSLTDLEPATGVGAQQYRIGYRLLDDSGEILTGLLLFTVDPATGTAAPALEPLAAASSAAAVPAPPVPSSDPSATADVAPDPTSAPDAVVQAAAPGVDTESGSWTWILVAVAMLLVVATAVALVLRRSRADRSA